MNNDRAIIIFKNHKRNINVDIDVPLDITATDLVIGLNVAYELGIDTSDINNYFLKSENPIALLRGSKTLAQYGIRNGSVVEYTG